MKRIELMLPWLLLALMVIGFSWLASLSPPTKAPAAGALPLIPTPTATPAPGLAEVAAGYQQQGDWQTAIETWRAHLIEAPQDAAAFYQLGLILAVFEPDAAPAHLQQAGQLDRQYAAAAERLTNLIRLAVFAEEPAYQYIQIGQALAAEDAWPQAQAAFELATQHNPSYAEAWAFLGQAYQQNGADGYPALQKALNLNQNSLTANVFMGLYWRAVGKPEVALVYLQNAAQLAPNTPALEIDIGNVLAELGNYADAQQHFLLVIELLPRDPNAWIALAEFSLHYEVQIEELGLPAARQIILLSPENPSGYALLGQAYSLQGDDFNAEKFLKQALQINSEYAPAHYYLGLYYLIQQQPQLAQEHLRLAVQFAGQLHADFSQRAQIVLDQQFNQP